MINQVYIRSQDGAFQNFMTDAELMSCTQYNTIYLAIYNIAVPFQYIVYNKVHENRKLCDLFYLKRVDILFMC